MSDQVLSEILGRLASLEARIAREEIMESPILAGGSITGSGSANQIAFFTGATSIGGSADLLFDDTTNRITYTHGVSQGIKFIGSGGTPATMYMGQGGSAGGFAIRTNVAFGTATTDDAAVASWVIRWGYATDDFALLRAPAGASATFATLFIVNSAGQVQSVDGSVTVPSFSWAADTNTGFYRFGADQVALALGGYQSLLLAQSAFKFRRGDSSGQFDGAQFVFYRSRAAGAAVANGDVIFDIAGNAEIASGEVQTALLRLSITDASANFDTQWDFYAAVNSALTNIMSLTGTAVNIMGSLQVDSIVNDTGLAHGTYTPTRSAETNLDANVTPTEAQYMRVGNTVTVSGRVTGVDPTLAATATSFELSLPVASNIGAVEDLAGTAACGAIAGQSAEVTGSVANNTAVVSWRSTDITSQSWSYEFTYQVI